MCDQLDHLQVGQMQSDQTESEINEQITILTEQIESKDDKIFALNEELAKKEMEIKNQIFYNIFGF